MVISDTLFIIVVIVMVLPFAIIIGYHAKNIDK